MKRVLITGVGGFVGSHTVEHFLKNTDWEIVGTDSWKHRGDSLRLRHLLAEKPWRDRLTVLTHDLRAPLSARLVEQIGPVDFVLNIASDSHVDRSITDPVPFVMNNVESVLNVAEYVRLVKPSFFIQCSTDEVFGPAFLGHDHKEDELHAPSNPYAASKAAQEDILFSYWRCYGIPYARTNTMNMIGSYQDKEKFVPLCISKIVNGQNIDIHGSETGGIGSRMYLHARNLADAWLFLLKEIRPKLYQENSSELQKPDAFNIVGERELNNLELAQMIAKFANRSLYYRLVDFHAARPGHDRRYALDGSKIAALGWKPPVALEESLRKTVEWYLMPENKVWLV